MPAVLEVDNLTKLYGDFRAVDRVSFSLDKGKILGLLGPNGAGKTTTIQMLVGITLPDGGSIRYFGQDLHRHREACLQRINYCSSYSMLQSRISVRENLIVYAGVYRVKKPEAKIRDLGEYFGIMPLMGQRFLTLSTLLQMDTANDQAASANIRLRWNYRPDSDLYVIYTAGQRFASLVAANPPQLYENRFAIKFTYSWRP